MMKVITEIHPYGSEERKYLIRELYIANTGLQSVATGKTIYNVWLNDPRGVSPRPKRDCEVRHLREDGDLILVAKCSAKLGKMINNLEDHPELWESLKQATK